MQRAQSVAGTSDGSGLSAQATDVRQPKAKTSGGGKPKSSLLCRMEIAGGKDSTELFEELDKRTKLYGGMQLGDVGDRLH